MLLRRATRGIRHDGPVSDKKLHVPALALPTPVAAPLCGGGSVLLSDQWTNQVIRAYFGLRQQVQVMMLIVIGQCRIFALISGGMANDETRNNSQTDLLTPMTERNGARR